MFRLCVRESLMCECVCVREFLSMLAAAATADMCVCV